MSTIVLICVYAFWITLIGGGLSLFGIRLYLVLVKKFELKKALYVLLIPCSFGFYQYIPERTTLTKWYRVLVVLFFVTAVIASLFMLYMHLDMDLI